MFELNDYKCGSFGYNNMDRKIMRERVQNPRTNSLMSYVRHMSWNSKNNYRLLRRQIIWSSGSIDDNLIKNTVLFSVNEV